MKPGGEGEGVNLKAAEQRPRIIRLSFLTFIYNPNHHARRRRERGATRIQARWRTAKSRREWLAVAALVKFAQSRFRMRGHRAKYVQQRRNGRAVMLQSAYRCSAQRRAFSKARSAVVALQCAARMRAAKEAVREAKRAARDVENIKKERDALRLEKERMAKELEEAKAALRSKAAVVVPPETEKHDGEEDEKDREIRMLREEMERLKRENAAAAVAPPALAPVTTPSSYLPPSTPDIPPPTPPQLDLHDDLLLEAETLRKKNASLEARARHAEALLASPPPPIAFTSPPVMTMNRSEVSTPIHHYYASSAKSGTQSALHFAVAQNDNESVKLMLEGTIPKGLQVRDDVNSVNHDLRTPLHCAVINGNYEIAVMLVSAKASVNAQDRNGDTPLHLSRLPSVASLLLSIGSANPNIPNSHGLTALHMAAKRGDLATASHLMESGADVNAREDKYLRTPVFDVALLCDLPMLKLFCERGVQPDQVRRTKGGDGGGRWGEERTVPISRPLPLEALVVVVSKHRPS